MDGVGLSLLTTSAILSNVTWFVTLSTNRLTILGIGVFNSFHGCRSVVLVVCEVSPTPNIGVSPSVVSGSSPVVIRSIVVVVVVVVSLEVVVVPTSTSGKAS